MVRLRGANVLEILVKELVHLHVLLLLVREIHLLVQDREDSRFLERSVYER